LRGNLAKIVVQSCHESFLRLGRFKDHASSLDASLSEGSNRKATPKKTKSKEKYGDKENLSGGNSDNGP
jgi:hypothetical protein